MSKKINIHIVRGEEGHSLQVISPNNGHGVRAIGPKAWGNPFNKPSVVFNNVDAEALCREIMMYAEDSENET